MSARRTTARRSAIASAILGTLLLSQTLGCAASMRATSQPAAPAASNAELMEYIGDQPFITAEPAGRAVYILWKGDVFEGDYSALVASLREGRVWPADDLASDAALSRAAVGHMVARACDIRGGVNWMITGLGRYAWRELQYKGIAGPGSELNLMTGGEFLGLLVRAEDYLQRHARGDARPVELGDDPSRRAHDVLPN